MYFCRAPQGARGLKCDYVWKVIQVNGRAPQGARGLKSIAKGSGSPLLGRAPQGARGLKFHYSAAFIHAPQSRPARGAWVEIRLRYKLQGRRQSRPARGAWVEIR